MLYLTRRSRLAAIAAVALLSLGASACQTTDDPDEPEIESIRLTISGQPSITVSSTGVQSGTLTLTQNVATTIQVEFLDASGAAGLGEHADEFQAQVTPVAGSGITFARTGPFAGTLTGATVGTGRGVSFSLLHIEENHEDFGPFTVNFTVNAPPTVVQR